MASNTSIELDGDGFGWLAHEGEAFWNDKSEDMFRVWADFTIPFCGYRWYLTSIQGKNVMTMSPEYKAMLKEHQNVIMSFCAARAVRTRNRQKPMYGAIRYWWHSRFSNHSHIRTTRRDGFLRRVALAVATFSNIYELRWVTDAGKIKLGQNNYFGNNIHRVCVTGYSESPTLPQWCRSAKHAHVS